MWGSSARPCTSFTLEGFGRDLAGVMDSAGVQGPALLGGLSLGAAAVLELALREPSRARALVLASYPAPRSWPGSFGGVSDS